MIQTRASPNKTRRRPRDPSKALTRSLYSYYRVKRLEVPHRVNENLQIFNVPGRGRGVRTSKANIPAGTLIYTEQALISEFKRKPIKTYGERLLSLVANLSRTDLEGFIQLTHGNKADTEIARLEMNSFSTSGTNEPNSVWRNISMINHSCCPNTFVEIDYHKNDQLSGTENKLVLQLRTLVDIPQKGTEIFIDYAVEYDSGDALQKVADKKKYIQEVWGFDCACDACQDPTGTNNRRMRINELEKELCCHLKVKLPPTDIVDRFMDTYLNLLMQENQLWKMEIALVKAITVYAKEVSGDDSDTVAAANEIKYRERLVKVTRSGYGAKSERCLQASGQLARRLKMVDTGRRVLRKRARR